MLFTNTSLTGVGLVVVLVELFLKWQGVEVPGGSAGENINKLVEFVGWLGLVFGQLRRKDLRWGLLRRN